MRYHVALMAAGCLLSRDALAQATTATPGPIGVWRGTSLCLVRPSPCNGEVVVYRITRAIAPDSVAIDARKIVKGREEEMGVLTCGFTAAQLTCSMPRGVWRFTVRGDSLLGELRVSDGSKFRDVRAARSR